MIRPIYEISPPTVNLGERRKNMRYPVMEYNTRFVARCIESCQNLEQLYLMEIWAERVISDQQWLYIQPCVKLKRKELFAELRVDVDQLQ